ncbi:30S ribosomal protein S3 [Candidatus Marsarchaeota G2 archaeon ECH_B_SAG-F08]|jgi:small subunit ribosomal protein S3|uniref:Small ribosomal subunit protein uS3 n=1 Tax=Candidatus Marsarchaeota G2 archaeon ECH_B_SAG-F08 TaxID=1978165 RepID=A0A2R6BFV2_9ARCH|nr:MAG: 30S ribosomal protein S3 [Candidatus Marsarchaeota G2 archaeon ECH_B_SAG-F08]
MVTIYKQFINENKRNLLIDEQLEEMYRKAGYQGVIISKVPLGHQVTIYAEKPGIIIGKKGGSIRDLSFLLEQKFGLENPQIEVRPIDNPELNSKIMANRIRFYLERGLPHKRVVFSALDSIMKAGAEGAEVTIRGKLTTERSRFIKLRSGRIHQSGEPASLIDKTVTYVLLKPGIIGIKVKIAKPGVFKPQIAIRQIDQALLANILKERESMTVQEAQVESGVQEQKNETKEVVQTNVVKEGETT